MAGLMVNMKAILTSLNDEAFNRIKFKLQNNRLAFANPKDHPMAGPLLQVLCEDNIIGMINRDHMSNIIEAIIPKDILETKWLSRYCDLLLRSLGSVQQNTSKDIRARKYADHLINTMIPDFKKSVQNTTKATKYIDDLSFIYKTASCLLRCTAHNKYPFSFSLDWKSMNELEKRMYKLPGSIFDQYRNEERAYVLLLSWILEEVICDQDGIGGENNA